MEINDAQKCVGVNILIGRYVLEAVMSYKVIIDSCGELTEDMKS